MKNASVFLYDEKDRPQLRIFAELWRTYISELSAYSKRLRDEPVTEGEIASMWHRPDTEIYFISADKNIIGFLLLGIEGNKHEDSDWFIGEFYISKNYQSQGIGKAAVRKILEEKRGRYCMFILKKNQRALRFWDKIFTENRYIDTSACFSCGHTPDDCVFRMNEPNM